MNTVRVKAMLSILVVCFLSSCSNPFDGHSIINIKSPSLTWDNQQYDFGLQAVGTTTTQTFEIINKGTNPATECQPVQLSDLNNFSIVTSSCTSASMLPGESCLVEIATHPVSIGQKQLQIQRLCKDNQDMLSPTSYITVVGVRPILNWDFLTHDFGVQAPNVQTAAKTFTLTNSGNTVATGCGLVSTSNASDFSIVSDSCGLLDLGIGQSCQITVVGNSPWAGEKTTTLSRTCAFGGTIETQMDEIKFTVVVPDMEFGPSSTIVTNQVMVGSSENWIASYHINNSSYNATSCSAPVLSNTTDFAFDWDDCSTVDVSSGGGACYVYLAFNPQSVGVKNSTVTRSCLVNGNTVTSTLNISGEGIAPSPLLSLSPDTNDLGSIPAGSDSGTMDIFVINNGPVAATGCSAPQLSNSEFSIIEDACGSNDLAAYSSCKVTISADVNSIGLKQTSATRTCTYGGTVNSVVNGYKANVIINADWQSEFGITHFGSISLGSNSQDLKFYLRNPTTIPLTGCGLSQLSNPADFSIISDTCGTSNLAAHSLCEVVVRASPQSLGATSTSINRSCTESGNIAITVNASGAPAATVANVSAGGMATCVTMSDQTVRCWGGQYYWWGSFVSAFPFAVSNLNSVTAVSTIGNQKSYALLSDGSLKTWNQSFSAYADGNVPYTNVTKIAVGYSHSCVVLSDATVRCWGSNNFGQLGDGTKNTSYSPVQVATINNAVDVTIIGSTGTCALLSDQTVKCWGDNYNGALGDGTGVAERLTPVPVVNLSGAQKIASGDGGHSCALLIDNTVKCWGRNYEGQSGDGSINAGKTSAVSVIGISNAVDIFLGGSHSCAILSDQTLKCWGANDGGQIDSASLGVALPTPVVVSGISNVLKAAAGYRHTCALLVGGSLKCWGANYSGQLGVAAGPNRLVPTDIAGLTGVDEVKVGSAVCAKMLDGTVKCWGPNNGAQLGDGTNTPSVTPVSALGVSNAAQLSTWDNSFATLNDGTVMAWGQNYNGSLGDGTNAPRNSPISISGLSNVVKTVGGPSHTCALINDGTIQCWGANWYGELGDGTSNFRSTPGPVLNISNATDIGLGDGFTCALLSDKTIKCWGYNASGQLGNGSTGYYNYVPSLVSGITNAESLFLGNNNSCAILTTGRVKCWGYNQSGQVGNGTTSTSVVTPADVSGITNAKSLAMSASHMCAVLTTGDLKCWGENSHGELGDLTYTNRSKPVYVMNISNVKSVGASGYTTCASMTNGTVKCWGQNSNGVLGISDLGKVIVF